MNIIASRRNKSKGLTVGIPIIPKMYHRQKSDYTISSLLEIPEDPVYSKSPKHPVHLQQSPRSKIYDKIHVLDEMGFGSLLNTNFEPNIDSKTPLKRRFSIGISDFWTGPNKQKFIRENGYKEAFNTMKKEVLINDLVKNASLRKPTLPYIMDSNTKRRNLIYSDNMSGKYKFKEQLVPILSKRQTNKLTDALNSVVEQCNILAEENKKFKIQTEKLRSNSNKKKKVTRQDREKISFIVQTMN